VTTHLGLMAVFSVFVSVAFAALTREEPADQLRFAVRLFAGFMLVGIVLGWVLYPLPL
jgi:hypothetical protein